MGFFDNLFNRGKKLSITDTELGEFKSAINNGDSVLWTGHMTLFDQSVKVNVTGDQAGLGPEEKETIKLIKQDRKSYEEQCNQALRGSSAESGAAFTDWNEAFKLLTVDVRKTEAGFNFESKGDLSHITVRFEDGQVVDVSK